MKKPTQQQLDWEMVKLTLQQQKQKQNKQKQQKQKQQEQQQQQTWQQVQPVHYNWSKRENMQQKQKVLKQFETKPPTTFYYDRKTKRYCLFHGTTSNTFESFLQHKGLLFKFYLTPNIQEAVKYAENQKQRRYANDPSILPAILVFRIKKELLEQFYRNTSVYIDFLNYFTIEQGGEDAQKLLKNSLVEMIMLKPKQQRKISSG